MAQETSWKDLSNLGWPINDVFRVANAQRGGTMSGIEDLHLNSGNAITWKWYSYNTLIGSPSIVSNVPSDTSTEQTAWSYDNTKNTEPFEDSWTESWNNTVSADLSITSNVTIAIQSSITIANVASTGFSISIALGSSSNQHKESSHTLSHTWDLKVGPGEKLSLIRVITHSTVTTEYAQSFGLTEGSMVGTSGRSWEGHINWGMNLNWLCNSPRGRMTLQGLGTSTTYQFKIVRETPKGRFVEYLSTPGAPEDRNGEHPGTPIVLCVPGTDEEAEESG